MQNIAFDFKSFYLHFLCQKAHLARQYNGSDEAKAFQENGSEIMLQQLKLVPFKPDTMFLLELPP
jgi:hypothetical protein